MNLKKNWFMLLGISFLLTSITLYFLHFFIFNDSYFIFKYVVAQLGFLPLNVFLVTIVLNQLMSRREKRLRMEKLNIIIGAFFNDIGTDLIKGLSQFYPGLTGWREDLRPLPSWTGQDYCRAKNEIRVHKFKADSTVSDLNNLQSLLKEKRKNLLRLLENPNLLEHEQFTELLWALFHLTEELDLRAYQDLDKLPRADYQHLSGDINRAYSVLLIQWLDYMHHMNLHYPYLFSLAMRTNPFDPDASIVIHDES
ncbi:MAG: hypothetical protein PHT79_02475 [Syntrophomonadaceae bacterium]|nr:hypothetical protein [Syntrophomonadaceae bacterium]MDD3888554.1 hypothetical protein [Syntrophomonadaceae bacterium]MDD4548604.1 hypothetical protein [Syntrophomonadaceae bacterium]